MAFNTFFPAGYQPYMNQGYMGQYQPQNSQNPGIYGQAGGNYQAAQNSPQSAIIWVQGEAGAKAYPVGPNQTLPLWDSENQTIYLKSTDAGGMPSMKILDYQQRETGKKNDLLSKVDTSKFVTKDELEKRLAEFTKPGGIRDEQPDI